MRVARGLKAYKWPRLPVSFPELWSPLQLPQLFWPQKWATLTELYHCRYASECHFSCQRIPAHPTWVGFQQPGQDVDVQHLCSVGWEEGQSYSPSPEALEVLPSARELFAFIWTPEREKFPQITPKLAVGRAAAKSFQAVVVARVYEKVWATEPIFYGSRRAFSEKQWVWKYIKVFTWNSW